MSVDRQRLDGKRGNEQLISGSGSAADARRDAKNEGTREANAATGWCVAVARAYARVLSMRASSDEVASCRTHALAVATATKSAAAKLLAHGRVACRRPSPPAGERHERATRW
eukprot:2746901-Pleurochrysis_carterae.AAC.2